MRNKENIKIPKGFEVIEIRCDGYQCVGDIYKRRYSVISSITKELDGNEWLHVSVSHRYHLPNYDVMKFIKHNFMHKNKDAIEIHAKQSNHVNINSNCRHLWSCLDKDFLPDFTQGTGSI